MQGNHICSISEIEYIPVDEERVQVSAVIKLLLEQLERAGADRNVPIIRYGDDER